MISFNAYPLDFLSPKGGLRCLSTLPTVIPIAVISPNSMATASVITRLTDFSTQANLTLPSLPQPRPLLLIGHGSRDSQGRESLLAFANAYQALDGSRLVVPCFLELTEPTILDGVDQCVSQGFNEISALPVLLFAARHNKFDVTNELDRARQKHPQVRFHYGRHFGIAPEILDLWHDRLDQLDQPAFNPTSIPREETVLLFVGRGASDPDANGDVCKLARVLWEGSSFMSVETCFIGITHPRLEEGFRRARLMRPRRIIVLPHFLFTGVLVKKIQAIAQAHQAQFPDVALSCLPEMGLHPKLMQVMRQRELETHLGQVAMNCEICKFRLAAVGEAALGGHHHHHQGSHPHGVHAHGSHTHGNHAQNGHGHHHAVDDPYAHPEQYHQRAWQVP